MVKRYGFSVLIDLRKQTVKQMEMKVCVMKIGTARIQNLKIPGVYFFRASKNRDRNTTIEFCGLN